MSGRRADGRANRTTGVISPPFYVSLPARATVLWPFAIAFAPKRRVKGRRVAGRVEQLFTFSPATSSTDHWRSREQSRRDTSFPKEGAAERERKHFTRFLFGKGNEGKNPPFSLGGISPHPPPPPAREPCRTLPTTILTDAAMENVNV